MVRRDLSIDIKREVLRLLHEDEEFRYAVAGMIGLDEILKRLDGYGKELVRHGEELVRLEEEIVRLREDMMKGFERHDRELERLRKDMRSGFELVERHISALGARWGLMAEEAFREGLKAFLEKELKLTIERWVQLDSEGIVYGYPSTVEVDISISDEKTTLIEVSSHVRPSDVLLFVRKTQFYEKATARKPDRRIMITPYVEKEALESAEKHGIEIYAKV